MNQPLIFPQPRGARLASQAGTSRQIPVSDAEREALALIQSLKDTLFLISSGCDRLATQLKEGSSLREDVKTVADAAAHAELLAQLVLTPYTLPPLGERAPGRESGKVLRLEKPQSR